jgi:hypothetical protein
MKLLGIDVFRRAARFWLSRIVMKTNTSSLRTKLAPFLVVASVLAGCASAAEGDDAAGAAAGISNTRAQRVAEIEVVEETVPRDYGRRTLTCDLEYLRVKTGEASADREINRTLEDDVYMRVDGPASHGADLRHVQKATFNQDGILSVVQRSTWSDSDHVIVETRTFDWNSQSVLAGLRTFLDQAATTAALALCSDGSRAKGIDTTCELTHWAFEAGGIRFYSDQTGVLVPYAKLPGVIDKRLNALVDKVGPQ